jgi:hypothetical protein
MRIVRPALLALACLVPFASGAAPAVKADDKTKARQAATFEVPYKFTAANHIVVRAKINGKGPFNFILDTGAPALFVAVPVGKKARVKADDKGWADLDRFELEGGLVIKKARARVETPFQLEGMNGLGLAGMEVHGLLGYDVLAKYRMTFDFTTDKLIFTELDYKPRQPVSLEGKGGGADSLQSMGKAMAALGKMLDRKATPDVKLSGFCGLTVAEGDAGPVVVAVLEKGPAGEAGLKKGDHITRVNDDEVKNVAALLAVTTRTPARSRLKLAVKRDGKSLDVTLETKEGI